MKNSKKLILVMISIICIVILLVGSIAYYRIVVSGSITGSTGNAVFVLRDTEDGESWNNKVINLGQINPGDSGSFDVVMDASGSSVDMYATLSIDRGVGDTELPTNLKFYTNSDHKSELHKYYSFLEKSGTNKETLTVYWYWNPYIDDIEDTKYMNKSFSASINVNAVQISEYAMMKNGYVSGSTANGGTEFWNKNYKPYIRTITFDNNLSNLPSSCTAENLCWDISYSTSQKKKVYGYLIDSGLTIEETDSSTSTTVNKTLYNLYIVSEAPIFAPNDSSYIFSFSKYENSKYISNLISIDFNNNFNTSKVTNMSSMFSGCSSLTSLGLSSFDTSEVTGMGSMFYYCSSLTSLDLSNFNTSKVTDMMQMFVDCSSLTNLDLSSFNTSKVTNMWNMFYGCSFLTNLDLSNFNTSNVTNMRSMFSHCSSLTSLDLSSFNTSKVTNMLSMFSHCSSLTSLDLSNFNTSKVTTMEHMFWECSSITRIDLSNFNISNVTNVSGMFSSCSSLTNLDLSSFNTSNVTSMSFMFSSCSSLTNLDLSSFNTSNVTNMSGMFKNCKKLQTQINIMNANISTYSAMFSDAATSNDASITVNYISSASTLVDNMIATKSSNSNVVKGSQI